MKAINNQIANYKTLLQAEEIQRAYKFLLNYVGNIRAYFLKSDKYAVGNISPGYMDYTYFPFFDEYLREHKLRFGIVLNHKQMQFELWLMGQNEVIQKEYWAKLKDTEWNKDRTERPQYSVLEVVLVENPDFEDLDVLTKEIENRAVSEVQKIVNYLKKEKIL